MGCGRIALERAGIPVGFYFASEIDKFAKQVTYIKCPAYIHKGSVVDVSAYDLPKIDLLIGGSPCQGFSNSGKGLNFDDPRSALFFEYVRILKECRKINPDVLFLLENVRMKKEWEDTISRILDIQPICINSALVSAQNRERLYWTNIAMSQRGLFGDNYCTIPQPKDKGIYLKDVLQPTSEVDEKYYISKKSLARIMKKHPRIDPDKSYAVNINNNGNSEKDRMNTLITERKFVTNTEYGLRETDKALCIDANYFKGMDNHGQITMVRELSAIVDKNRKRKPNVLKSGTFTAGANSAGNHTNMDLLVIQERKMIQLAHGFNSGGEVAKDGKCPSITTSSWEQNNLIYQKIPQADRIYGTEDKSVTISARDGGLGAGTGLYNVLERIRRLTPIEVCRLQTVPDDYFFKDGKQIVSDSQIYKMCGNGWTIDVIVWILQHIKPSKIGS